MAESRVIDGRYELIELVGSGGMAEVWRARDRRLNRVVAVKLLSASAARDASRRRKIAREARALAAANHPNIVAVYDYGEAEGPRGEVVPYLVMELVDGPDLRQYLAERGPLPIDEGRAMMLGVLAAVERAHDSGVVHGDLKPANIFMGSMGPKVGDFGVARILEEETGATTLAATPTFAAPEVLKGERPTRASDLYSAGCLAFELFAGRPPYEGANGWEVAQKHMDAPIPHVRKIRTDVPPELDATLRRAMEKEPRRRFEGAGSFAAALGAVATQRPPTATVPVAPVAIPRTDETQALTRRPDLRRAVFLGALAPAWTRVSGVGRTAVRGLRRSPLALLVTTAAVLIILAFLAMRSNEPEFVKVPNVQGKTIQEASSQLRMAAFKVEGVSFRPVTDGQPGRVLATIPASGAEVEPATEIHIIATAKASTPRPTPVARQPARVQNGNEDAEDREEGRGKGNGKGKRDD